MTPQPWEDLDHHLRRIGPPWSDLTNDRWLALMNEVILRQTGHFPKQTTPLPDPKSPQETQLLRICLWILTHGCFQGSPRWAEGFPKILTYVRDLSAQVSPALFLKDPERREEIVRFIMDALGIEVLGESAAQTLERRESLDSLARARILQETRASQARAQAIRDALALQEAEEAASKYNRE